MNFLSILRIACCLCMLAGLAPAAEKQDKVSVRFIRVPSTADDRTALLKLDDGQTMEIELPTSALSPPYQVAKPEAWVLGKAGESDGFVEMGRAKTTDSETQVVVVIDKGAINDGKLELIAMDLTLVPDAFVFVNASRYDISGELGIERFGIAPMEYALLMAEASRTDRGRRFCDASFNFLKKDAENYTPFYSSSWRLTDGVFGLVIFHHEAIHDKLKFTVIRDFVPDK